MIVVKKVQFTKEEVDSLTKDAVCKAASAVIGAPTDDERFEISIITRGKSTVSIVNKEEEAETQEGSEA